MPRLAKASSSPSVTERCGTKRSSSVPLTVRRTSRQYVKVAMKVPSAAWLIRSRTKFRSSRGPNCDDASWRATTGIENATLVIVIIELATAESTAREPSGPRVNVQPRVATQFRSAVARSNRTVASDNATAPATMVEGTNQKFVRRSSHRFSNQVFIDVPRMELGGFQVALDMAFRALSKYDFCFVGMGFPEVGSLGMEANGV